MSVIMKPFIGIYHVVSTILSFPTRIFKKSTTKLAESIEEKKLENAKKNNTVINQQKEENYDVNKSLVQDNRMKKPKTVRKPLISYRYYAVNSKGKKVTGIMDGVDESDAKGFLESEGLKVTKIELKKKYDIIIGGNGKIKVASLAFALTQLSTYIKAGIPLVDSVRILSKQAHDPSEKKAFSRLVYELLKGENLSGAMERQGDKFPKLLINMIKTAEMTGDLPTILDDMADYYTSMEQTRKQMISAMTYPVVVLLLAVGVLVFMLVYLVPQFVQMFESQDATLPAITLFIIGASNFLKNHYIMIILVILIIVIIFAYLYKNVKQFRTTIQVALMHLPVVKDVIIYNEVSNFTKTFASLLNHGVFITDSMEVLSKITNNEVYKRIINKTLSNLGKGESISKSFENEWAFPIVAYEMLVTGERTGQLGLMMEKVAEHFQVLHKAIIDQLKSLIEPLMIIFLAGIVGIILLSIIVPMFDIYGKIK